MKFMNNMKKRNSKLKTIIYAAAMTMVTAFSAFAGTTAFAEGSRDLAISSQENADAVAKLNNPSATEVPKTSQSRWNLRSEDSQSMGVSNRQKIKFYAYEGEVAFFGSNWCGNTTADIIITRPNGEKDNINLTESKTGDKDTDEYVGSLCS